MFQQCFYLRFVKTQVLTQIPQFLCNFFATFQTFIYCIFMLYAYARGPNVSRCSNVRGWSKSCTECEIEGRASLKLVFFGRVFDPVFIIFFLIEFSTKFQLLKFLGLVSPAFPPPLLWSLLRNQHSSIKSDFTVMKYCQNSN